jgi:hypothetical protein
MSEPLPGELLSAQRMEPEKFIAKMPAGQEEPAAHDLSEMEAGELTEARRIAGELVRLHRDGAIRSQKDASFDAHLLRDFDATYTGPARSVPAEPPGPMCRLPCSASAFLADSPWRNGEGSRRHGWLEGYKAGRN